MPEALSSARCNCDETAYAAQKLVAVLWGAYGRSERPVDY